MLEIRGGVLQGRTMSAAEVEALATLPPLESLRGQVLAAIIAPITALAGLVNAPLQNLVGLIDARIEQLGGADAAPAPAAEEPASEEPAAEEPAAEAAVGGTDRRRRRPHSADATASASETDNEPETTEE